MKNIVTQITLILTLIFIVSCNKEVDLSAEDSISRNMTIELIKKTKSKSKTGSQELNKIGSLKINLTNEESNLIDFELSDEIIEFIGLPKDEIYNKIYEVLDKNNYATKKYASKNFSKETPYRTCISGCSDKYTDADGNKIKGRGWCKAGCFGQAVVDAIVEAIPTIVGLILD